MRSQTLDKHACNRWVVVLITIFTAFRLWYASQHELVPDESYYWQWSRHLAHGYYDNTPVLAYVIRFCTDRIGVTELGVRMAVVLSAAVTSAFMYLLALRLISPIVGLITVIVANIIPLFAGGAVLMTQDPLQVALWSVTAFVVWLAIEPAPSRSPSARFGLWFIAGVFAGVTTMTKLNGILILPAVLCFLLTRFEMRAWLRTPGPYVAAVVAIVMTLPFYQWDMTHGDAFGLHASAMSHRRFDHGNWPGRSLLEFIGSQVALISPGIFLIFLVCLWAYRPTKDGNAITVGRQYFWTLAIVPLIVTVLVALRTRVEANWSVTAYITGTILMADWIVARWTAGTRRTAISISVALAAAISGGAVFFPGYARLAVPKINELYGWHDMAYRTVDEQYAMGASCIVCGLNYRMPSELAFYLPNHPRTYCLFLNNRANEYMFWENPRDLVGKNAVVVNDAEDTTPAKPDTDLPDLRQVFLRVEKQPSLKIYRATSRKPLRTVQFYRCYGFKGYDVKKWQKGW